MKRRDRGLTLIEILVGIIMMGFIGAGLVVLLGRAYESQYMLLGQNGSNANARQAVDLIEDGWSASGVTYPGLRGATALANGTNASDLRYTCTDSAGTSHTVRYVAYNGNLIRCLDGVLPVNGKSVVQNVTSLTLSYYNWNGTSWDAPVSIPAAPASIGAVCVQAGASLKGQNRTVQGIARLRGQRCTITASGKVF